jgi:hypothetical protein
VLSAADRIHAPDWAEAKHSLLGDRWIQEGALAPADVLAAARDSRNAAHGGFLPISALYATLTVPLGHADSFAALKVIALAFATLGFLAWTLVAARLAGPLGGALAALLLLFPPPAFLAGSLIAWGSHAEGAALLGVAALALVSGAGATARGAFGLALALGATAAMSSLYLPIASLLLVAWLLSPALRDPEMGALDRRRLAIAAAGAALPLLGVWLLTGGLNASVTEEAGNSPLQLLRSGATSLALIPATLPSLLPLPAWGPELLGDALRRPTRMLLDGVLGLFLLAALWEVACGARRRPELGGRILALLLVVPATHGLLLLLLGPRRPSVELRYLLPLWPILLVAIAVAASWAWQRRSGTRQQGWAALLLAGVALWALPGLQTQAGLVEPGRIGSPSAGGSGFFAYRATAYVDHEIGNVRYETAPGVNDFLAQRGADTRGFGLVPRLPASQDLLREAEPPVLEPIRILDRLQRDRATQPPAGPERTRIYANIGWALAVFAPDRPGLWHGILSNLGADREAAAAGLGMGLSRSGAAGCERILAVRGPDREAMLRGALSLDANFAPRCAAAAASEAPAPQPAAEQQPGNQQP